MRGGEGIEGIVDKITSGLGILQLLQPGDPLIVFHAGGFHFAHLFRLQFIQLPPQDNLRIFHDGFHHEVTVGQVLQIGGEPDAPQHLGGRAVQPAFLVQPRQTFFDGVLAPR